MVSREKKFSPGFSISHGVEAIFPTREERSEFGYSPFDLFLIDRIPETVIDPRLAIEGGSPERLLDNLNEDYILVFRYKKDDFDVENVTHIPDGVEHPPVFQRDFLRASLKPNSDFSAVIDILGDTIEQVTDADYLYTMDMKHREGVRRATTFGEYLDEVCGQPFLIWPDSYGINEIEIHSGSMTANLSVYQQEVIVQRGGDPGFSRYGIPSEGEEGGEEVYLGYDESEIEALENKLLQEGFDVNREYLPQSVSPSDI